MKKVKFLILTFPFLFLLFPILFIFGMFSSGSASGSHVTTSHYSNLSPNVLRYHNQVKQYAEEYGVVQYVPYLLAIMQVESGGNGDDPMQSSESIDGNIGNIKNPTDSIKQGVIHFKSMLDRATIKGSDIWAVVQAYNYGGGFIDYLNGKSWNFPDAEKFSYEHSKGEKVRYINDVSKSKGYDYRYNYGNMFYVFLVQKYVLNNKAYDGTFVLPLQQPITITSGFGEERRLLLQDGRIREDIHKGVDFVNGNSQAPIIAVASGQVVYSQFLTGGGLSVVIKHSDELYTHYYHLSSIQVKLGDNVSQNQVLGIIGTTGDSTGIHLHFGVSKQQWSDYIDPLSILPTIE